MSKVRLLVLLLSVAIFALPVMAQDDAPPTLVSIGESDLGPVLIGQNGFTLYLFTRDGADVSNCYERCAEAWPPLLVGAADAELTMGEGVPGTLGVIERTTGTFQVTYNGMPLYYWWRDWAPGMTTGQGVGEVKPRSAGYFYVGPQNKAQPMDAITSYLQPGRLADVLALIQVLAYDRDSY